MERWDGTRSWNWKLLLQRSSLWKFYNMKKFQIKDVLALVEVNLDFEIPEPDETGTDEDWGDICKGCENIVRELFESLHQVKKLIVGKWCLLCKCLTMKTSLKRWDLASIASLLQSSPYVETLVIDIISSPLMDLEYLIRSYDEVKHWKLKEVYFKSLLRTPEECQDLRFWRNFLHK